MTDITNLFKATIKTVKARNKAQGITNGPDKSILGKSKVKGEFAIKSTDVINHVKKLQDFLLEHRKDYINAGSHLGKEVSPMTDAERDQIDTDAQTFMRTCSEAIKLLKAEAKKDKVSDQVKEHREAVVYLLEQYLKSVCKIYSEQRAIRVKRVVDRKRIARLEPEKRRQRKKSESNETEDTKEEDKDKNENVNRVSKEHLEEASHFEEEDELSPEEAQMFQQENEQLFNEMNSIVDEVRQIEGKVVEISRLQEIFADKVLEQEKDIDRIGETVVGTTENIKEANEEIRQAMKNNAGMRVWILFFLIVLSFSLLFLDWYNP